MKKLTAILFLGLLLFNLAGYRLWFYYVQQEADAQLVTALDNERYSEQDLVELRVPLTLPYHTDWKGFERVNGEIEIEGTVYKYVKRTVVNGELVLFCLPDANKEKIETARETFFRLANSLQSDQDAKKQNTPHTLSFKNILSDYDCQQQSWLLAEQEEPARAYPIAAAHHLLFTPADKPEKPPEA